MNYLKTLTTIKFPINIQLSLLEESLKDNKLVDKLIIHILKLENNNMWENQVFNRGKLNVYYNNINNYIKDKYIEKVPTNIQCYLKNPNLCWLHIKTRNDVKKLLYLSMELNIETNIEMLELATTYSSINCYPYDEDYTFNHIYSGINMINRITKPYIILSMTIMEQIILYSGCVLYYSENLISKLLETNFYGKRNIYYTEKNVYYTERKFINIMKKTTIVTKLKDKYIVYYYDYTEKKNEFSFIKILDKPDELFKLKIYMINKEIKISASPEFLVYMCTKVIPVELISDHLKNSKFPKENYININEFKYIKINNYIDRFKHNDIININKICDNYTNFFDIDKINYNLKKKVNNI